MKKRVITGAVYVALLIALLVFKWLVPVWGALGYDALFCAVAVIGSIELARAFKDVSYVVKVISVAYCAVMVPLFAAVEMTAGGGYLALLFCTLIYALAVAVTGLARLGGTNLKGMGAGFFIMAYCGVMPCLLSVVNHLPYNSVCALLSLFFIASLTDSMAFIVGSLLKKRLPYKLAPKISPNKTIIGGAGGLLGGMIGAVAAYYIYYGMSILTGGALVYGGTIPAAVVFLLIGFVTSVFCQAGDLFESALKRKCGVKDMGKILPGHGGVLDRFDSILAGGLVIAFAFGIVVV